MPQLHSTSRLVFLVTVALTVVSCRAASPATNSESATQISVALPSYEHPRLYFSAAQIPQLRSRAATTNQDIWRPIDEFTDTLLTELPPASPPVDGNLDTYRNFGNQLIPLAFNCVITDEDAVCAQGKAYLLRYATWEQWGNQGERDLGLAHMLIGNALAYDWLYGRLSSSEREIVRESLANWAARMYEASVSGRDATWNNWWTGAYAQNHFTTNISAIGVSGLVLLGEDSRAEVWVNHAISQFTRMQTIWEGIGDGTWHEGISYQAYGLTMSLIFLHNLRLIEGIDLLPHTYLQNYGVWRIYNYLPGSTEWLLAFANFEWDWGISRELNVLRFVASEYNAGYVQWLADQLATVDGRFATVYAAPWYVLEFLYYDADLPAQAPSDLATTRVFPDLEGVIWRTGWEQDDLAFGLKTGPYGGRSLFDTFTAETYPWQPPCLETDCRLSYGHDHDDTNTFYLYRGGQWLAPEVVGVGNNETSFHNTILIDNQGQYRPSNNKDPAQFRGSDGSLTAVANTPHYDYLAADATRRYRNIDGIQSVLRLVVFVRPDYLIIVDHLAADRPHQYMWVSHFGESVSIDENWITGSTEADQILGVGVVRPQEFVSDVGNDGRPFVHIRSSERSSAIQFINILFPTDTAIWPSRPDIGTLIEANGAVALQVNRDAEANLTDDILVTYNRSVESVFPSYSYDGQVAVITRDESGRVQRLFMVDGTFLQDQTNGEVLVTSSVEVHALEVENSGTTITVSIEAERPVELSIYAPDASSVTVNGEDWPFTRDGDLLVFEWN